MGIASLLELWPRIESDSCVLHGVSWLIEPKGEGEKVEQIRAVLDKEDIQASRHVTFGLTIRFAIDRAGWAKSRGSDTVSSNWRGGGVPDL